MNSEWRLLAPSGHGPLIPPVRDEHQSETNLAGEVSPTSIALTGPSPHPYPSPPRRGRGVGVREPHRPSARSARSSRCRRHHNRRQEAIGDSAMRTLVMASAPKEETTPEQ